MYVYKMFVIPNNIILCQAVDLYELYGSDRRIMYNILQPFYTGYY